MGFFERNRDDVVAAGYDPSRLPPGQYLTDRFPVLHVGDVPEYAPGAWNMRIFGEVDNDFSLTFEELTALPSVEITTDIHCVTKWSKFDTTWRGVRVRDLFERAGLRPPGRKPVAERTARAQLPLHRQGLARRQAAVDERMQIVVDEARNAHLTSRR